MKLFKYFFERGFLAFALALIMATISVPILLVHMGSDESPLSNLVYLTVLPLLFTLIVMIADTHIKTVIRFVTDGNVDGEHYILRYLFDQRYFVMRMDDAFFSLYTVSSLIVYPIWLSLEFPILLPYILTIGSVLGIYLGLLYLARFTYRLSLKLSKHINDPNAHGNNRS